VPEPLDSAKKAMKPLRSTRQRFAANLAAACFVLAAALFVQYLASSDSGRLSRRNCRMVRATIVAKGQSLRTLRGLQSPSYIISYGFDFGGRHIESRSEVDREYFAWLDTGDIVDIYVDVTNPERSFLKQEYDLRVARWLRLSIMAFAVSLLAASYYLYRRLFRRPAKVELEVAQKPGKQA